MKLCTPLRAFALTAAVMSAALASFGAAAQTVKVGIVGPFSGPFAHYGTLFKNGAEAYMRRRAASSRARTSS